MITIDNIEKASTPSELNDLVEMALFERGCEASHEMTYAEQAEFFAEEAKKSGNGSDGLLESAEILAVAENRWFELS